MGFRLDRELEGDMADKIWKAAAWDGEIAKLIIEVDNELRFTVRFFGTISSF